MYAIIRAGGKQSKVQAGDVLDIERVKGDETELTFEPLLVVDDEGNAVSDQKALAKASVQAKILGESKNKTGYRRRQGHRQKYTQIEITGITLPGSKAPAKKAATSKKPTADKSTSEKAAPEEKAASKKAAAPKKAATETKATAAKKAAAGKASSTKKAAGAKKPKAAASEEE
jgi:large subunit ribosomal protein L21